MRDHYDFDLTSDPSRGPRIKAKGVFSTDPTDRARKLLDIDQLEIGLAGRHGLRLDDAKLIESLPADLKNFVERLRSSGELTGEFSTLLYSYRVERRSCFCR